jgi:hypothetical protein
VSTFSSSLLLLAMAQATSDPSDFFGEISGSRSLFMLYTTSSSIISADWRKYTGEARSLANNQVSEAWVSISAANDAPQQIVMLTPIFWDPSIANSDKWELLWANDTVANTIAVSHTPSTSFLKDRGNISSSMVVISAEG